MTDTYNIGSLENDRIQEWEDRGYEVIDGQTLKNRVQNGDLQTVDEEINRNDTPDQSDVMKLGDNEDVLILTEDRVKESMTQEELDLRRELRQKRSSLQQKQAELRQARSERREEQEDLEGLQDQLNEVQQRVEDINNRFEELGLTPPIISTEEINNLPSQDQQEARELLSERGSLNNTIGTLRNQVEEQQQVVQQATEEVDTTRQERNNLQDEITDLENRIEIIQPITQEIEVLLDVILICVTEWETYISGRYIPPGSSKATRRIMGQGTKSVRIGARAPIKIRDTQNEEDFWDQIYQSVRQEVFRNPGSFPEGEWFDRLVQELQSLGQAASAGSFTGSNWQWNFGKDFASGAGSHEFPEESDFEDEKQDACENWIDIQLR